MADNLENARAQALAQFESIREMVAALNAAIEADDSDAIEDAERAIHEDALSFEVRCDWYNPFSRDANRDSLPSEFRILLCTGGPAVQLVGSLDAYNEPTGVKVQCQDWFTPWTDVEVFAEDVDDILETYARQFTSVLE